MGISNFKSYPTQQVAQTQYEWVANGAATITSLSLTTTPQTIRGTIPTSISGAGYCEEISIFNDGTGTVNLACGNTASPTVYSAQLDPGVAEWQRRGWDSFSACTPTGTATVRVTRQALSKVVIL